MSLPGFYAESVFSTTKRMYQSYAVFGESTVGEILSMQAFVVPAALSRNLLAPPLDSRGESQSTPFLSSETCIDILYTPVCHQINPFTECCTRSHEVRCPTSSSPTETCTRSEVFSCTECHPTITGFPTDGVIKG